jgi:hypothetical protein
MHTQSYCLKAGTHGPGGHGYLYGPPKGPAQEAVVALVRNSVQRTEIGRHDIQLLLWAIIARAKFENLSPQLKLVAGRLLTPQQIAMLNRTALDFVPDAAKPSALASMPAPHPPGAGGVGAAAPDVQRRRVQLPADRVCRGAGRNRAPGRGQQVSPGRPLVPASRRLFRSLSAGRLQPHVDPAVVSDTVPARLEYHPALHIAVPGNPSRQRLIQSGRAHAP